MPLNDTQLKDRVILDVGDLDGLLASEIDNIWLAYDELLPWERFLRARVDAVNRLLAKARFMIQSSGDGRTMHLEEIFNNLYKLRNIYVAEATAYIGSLYTPAGPDVTEMTAEFPVEGLVGWPDPNNQALGGNIVARQSGIDPYGYGALTNFRTP